MEVGDGVYFFVHSRDPVEVGPGNMYCGKGTVFVSIKKGVKD